MFPQWLRGSGIGVEVVMAATVGWEDQAWEEHLTDPRLLDLFPCLVAHKGDHRPAAYTLLPKNMIDRHNPWPSLERGASEIHLSKI